MSEERNGLYAQMSAEGRMFCGACRAKDPLSEEIRKRAVQENRKP